MSQVPPPLPTSDRRTRHGCLTTWLVLMIFFNALTAVATPVSMQGMREAALQPNLLLIGALVFCGIANVVFAIALFKWQKWGFYGFFATSLVALVVNLSIGLGIGKSLFGLIGIALLYWVLNMGGANKAWPHLR